MAVATHEAMLYEKLTGSRARCNVCQWRCVINPDKFGVCRMRQNTGGAIYTLNYAQASSVAPDPIEKKPLFHFHPGTLAFSLGGWGCNFHCLGCQNWEISCVEMVQSERGSRIIPPQQAVQMTRQYHCQGIAWTYNEPTMWFEYTLDSAKLAKKNNLYTVYVTNGYATPEALDAIGPYLDAANWRGILEVARRAKAKWNMHIEVITNIIPTLNDDDQQLEGIARWIKDELGELTPWHVTRFYPQYQMLDFPPTPLSTIERAYEIGQKVGLKFIYAGNIPGHQSESTVCYSCGKTVVQRFGYQAKVVGLDGSKCKFCGAELNFRTPGTMRR